MISFDCFKNILAVDVSYNDTLATVAGVTFSEPVASEANNRYVTKANVLSDYMSGEFYKRELPCILSLLAAHCIKADLIIVDGYVFLDAAGKPGLGYHLYESLGKEIPVIGVAKNPRIGAPVSFEVFRGVSKKPLHVSSVGVEQLAAKEFIKRMHGQYRIPTLLKLVDTLSRKY